MLGVLLVCLALQIAPATPEASPSPSPSPTEEPVLVPDPAVLEEPAPEPPPAPAKKLWLALGASAVFPGGGFFYLGHPHRGAAYLAVESVELAAVATTIATANYDPDDPASEDRLARVFLPALWLQNTHLVGMYDAYRAARMRQPPGRYRTPIPEPGLSGLLRAPLRGRMLLRPEIGIPLGTVKSRLRLAMARLRHLLSELS